MIKNFVIDTIKRSYPTSLPENISIWDRNLSTTSRSRRNSYSKDQGLGKQILKANAMKKALSQVGGGG